MSTNPQISELITRTARLNSSETWGNDLNPVQVSAIGYLARANRFSRSPSHVAEYLGTTRGTMSQTMKALERKGYVKEIRSETDKRSISYVLTLKGNEVAATKSALEAAICTLPEADKGRVERALSAVVLMLVEQSGGKPFGLCKTCRHHQRKKGTFYCGLLQVALEPEEIFQICHEQAL